MTEFEKLEDEAYEGNVNVINYDFASNRIKGMYCDGTVALNTSLETDAEKKCILAEELGHHYTASGNILGNDSMSIRQEAKGRIYAYNKLIGLSGLIRAYKAGCKNLYDTSEYLGVTEDFLLEAINAYKQKYGICTAIDNYVIYFEPHLGVLELI